VTPLTPGDGHDILERYKRALERSDVDLAVSLYREDAELRPDPFEPPLAGDLAIRAHWNDLVASRTNAEFDAEGAWVSGRTVLASWHGAYTRRSSAERIRERGFTTIELDDNGLIARQRLWVIERNVGTDRTYEPHEG
jgi:ketosteroid isomerase-like protein